MLPASLLSTISSKGVAVLLPGRISVFLRFRHDWHHSATVVGLPPPGDMCRSGTHVGDARAITPSASLLVCVYRWGRATPPAFYHSGGRSSLSRNRSPSHLPDHLIRSAGIGPRFSPHRVVTRGIPTSVNAAMLPSGRERPAHLCTVWPVGCRCSRAEAVIALEAACLHLPVTQYCSTLSAIFVEFSDLVMMPW